MKLILSISLTLLAAIIILVISAPIVNNDSAKKTADYLERITLPEHTNYIGTFSDAGKFVGSGNGMQYLGCILIKSELDLDELTHYYSAYAFNEWTCLVEEANGTQPDFLNPRDWGLEFQPDTGTYYIVYSWGSGISPFSELDLRGH